MYRNRTVPSATGIFNELINNELKNGIRCAKHQLIVQAILCEFGTLPVSVFHFVKA
jgi:hypothetical protein